MAAQAENKNQDKQVTKAVEVNSNIDAQITKNMDEANYKEACKLYFQKLKANKDDAKANKDDVKAKKMYFILKRVVRYEKMYANAKDSKQKAKLGMALRSFYYSVNNIKSAEKIDQDLYNVNKTEITAYRLAASQLNLNKFAESIKTLDSVKTNKMMDQYSVLKAYCYQKLNKPAEATKALQAIKIDELKKAQLLLLCSKIYALQGEKGKACKTLAKSFENTMPNKIETLKKYVSTEDKDFANIKNDEAFKTALTTKSKIKISDCSGGSSCGSCKLKSSCKK